MATTRRSRYATSFVAGMLCANSLPHLATAVSAQPRRRARTGGDRAEVTAFLDRAPDGIDPHAHQVLPAHLARAGATLDP